MTDVCFSGAALAVLGAIGAMLTGAIALLYRDAQATLDFERQRTIGLQRLLEDQAGLTDRSVGVQTALASRLLDREVR